MNYVKGIQNKINQEIFEEIRKVKRVELEKKRKTIMNCKFNCYKTVIKTDI